MSIQDLVRAGILTERSSQIFISGPKGTAEILGPALGKAGSYRAHIQFKSGDVECERAILRSDNRTHLIECVCEALAGGDPLLYCALACVVHIEVLAIEKRWIASGAA